MSFHEEIFSKRFPFWQFANIETIKYFTAIYDLQDFMKPRPLSLRKVKDRNIVGLHEMFQLKPKRIT